MAVTSQPSNGGHSTSAPEPPQHIVDQARTVATRIMEECEYTDLDTGQDLIDTLSAAESIADEVVGLAWAAALAREPQGPVTQRGDVA
jgi:predicted hydrolase (HD superfamily)